MISEIYKMINKKNSVPARFDSETYNDLNQALMTRLKNGLIGNRKELSMPEITSLMRKTKSWKPLLLELKTKPKRRTP